MILATITNETGWLRRYECGGECPRLTHSAEYGCYVDLMPATMWEFRNNPLDKHKVGLPEKTELEIAKAAAKFLAYCLSGDPNGNGAA